MFEVSRIGVSGAGFRDSGLRSPEFPVLGFEVLGFRVHCLDVWGFVFGVEGFAFRGFTFGVSGLALRVSVSRFKVAGSGFFRVSRFGVAG